MSLFTHRLATLGAFFLLFAIALCRNISNVALTDCGVSISQIKTGTTELPLIHNTCIGGMLPIGM